MLFYYSPVSISRAIFCKGRQCYRLIKSRERERAETAVMLLSDTPLFLLSSTPTSIHFSKLSFHMLREQKGKLPIGCLQNQDRCGHLRLFKWTHCITSDH